MAEIRSLTIQLTPMKIQHRGVEAEVIVMPEVEVNTEAEVNSAEEAVVVFGMAADTAYFVLQLTTLLGIAHSTQMLPREEKG